MFRVKARIDRDLLQKHIKLVKTGLPGLAWIKFDMRFGSFVAVDHVYFRIRRGEIFGFIGSNGCGKSTTMKMLTGLLPASEGHASLFGHEVNPKDIETRRRVGYMSQGVSLDSELSVHQNPVLHMASPLTK